MNNPTKNVIDPSQMPIVLGLVEEACLNYQTIFIVVDQDSWLQCSLGMEKLKHTLLHKLGLHLNYVLLKNDSPASRHQLLSQSNQKDLCILLAPISGGKQLTKQRGLITLSIGDREQLLPEEYDYSLPLSRPVLPVKNQVSYLFRRLVDYFSDQHTIVSLASQT